MSQIFSMSVIYDTICTKCSWVSTSWQWSVNCTQIEDKQLCTWEETINKTMQKQSTHKRKAKHTKQENKHKTNKLKDTKQLIRTQ